MENADSVREEVSKSYTRAVQQPQGGCCDPKGVAFRHAGYSAEELAALPQDAVANAFGCGNPLAFAEVRPGETVLDLGSGAGIDLLIAAEKVGPEGRVIGVDMTDEMVERARANAAAKGLHNVEVRKGLIEALPVEDASVDWVISNCVINLSPEKDKVFAEIARVLKPGGRGSISDIVVEGLPEEVRANREFYTACVAGAIREADYLAGLRRAGLEAEVTDRCVYDAGQLLAFAASCEAPPGFEKLVPALAGKVWSARFALRKPELRN